MTHGSCYLYCLLSEWIKVLNSEKFINVWLVQLWTSRYCRLILINALGALEGFLMSALSDSHRWNYRKGWLNTLIRILVLRLNSLRLKLILVLWKSVLRCITWMTSVCNRWEVWSKVYAWKAHVTHLSWWSWKAEAALDRWAGGCQVGAAHQRRCERKLEAGTVESLVCTLTAESTGLLPQEEFLV